MQRRVRRRTAWEKLVLFLVTGPTTEDKSFEVVWGLGGFTTFLIGIIPVFLIYRKETSALLLKWLSFLIAGSFPVLGLLLVSFFFRSRYRARQTASVFIGNLTVVLALLFLVCFLGGVAALFSMESISPGSVDLSYVPANLISNPSTELSSIRGTRVFVVLIALILDTIFFVLLWRFVKSFHLLRKRIRIDSEWSDLTS